jgi:hypothetical protein
MTVVDFSGSSKEWLFLVVLSAYPVLSRLLQTLIKSETTRYFCGGDPFKECLKPTESVETDMRTKLFVDRLNTEAELAAEAKVQKFLKQNGSDDQPLMRTEFASFDNH